MKPVVSMQFLGDEETVKKAMEAVANQGKAKKAEPKAEEVASLLAEVKEPEAATDPVTEAKAVVGEE